MPDSHALLGPSSAHRWIACPPSARLSEGIEDEGSEYAKEGTLAHRVGELLLRKRWEGADITDDLEAAQADPLYSGEMGEHIRQHGAGRYSGTGRGGHRRRERSGGQRETVADRRGRCL